MTQFYGEHTRLLVSVDSIVFGFEEDKQNYLSVNDKWIQDVESSHYMVDSSA